ncbi:unnamed protein product [Brachionus calyciflorus]|uniref:FLYWCH-type domain-containing protein n=1 Tax=Brachionus calyciflorus TaxID=104777 RepID=A0A814HMF2_9BILA|nr:unnamed protein product [Brachionus calyciflorus]
MNKNWLKDNSNFSPSIRKLRNRRILDEKPANKTTSNIQSNFVEKNSNQVESDVNTDVYINQNCHGFSLMQNFSENVGESSSSSSSSSCDESSDSDVSIISTDSEQFDEVEEFYGELSDELNKLTLENKDFFLTKTKTGGLKLCSLGYYYTKERLVKNNNKYHWKCESTKSCNGRAHTIGLEGPLLITVAHTHQPDIIRKQKLINDEKYKQMAENTKENPREIMTDVQKCVEEDVVVQNSNYENIRR